MKYPILLLAIFTIVISSCTTAYKTGQTPDDVYYSPVRAQDEYVRVEEDNDRYYRYDDQYYDDRYLRMKVMNRTRWSELNDWYYYDRYSYAHNYYWGSYYNPYNSWNYFYNPYCPRNIVIINPKQPASQTNIVKPRLFNLSSYTNDNYNNNNTVSNTKTAPQPGVSRPVFNNTNAASTNQSRGLGNAVRQIFSNSNNNSTYNSNNSSNNSNSTNRSYTPSNSSNNNSSGNSNNNNSGGGGGGVSRPTRGGN